MRIRLHSSRIGTALFVVLLVVGLTAPLFVAADSKEANEPNDVQEAATPVTGTSVDGELTKQGGIDWYSKKFSKGDTVSFAVTKPLWDLGVKVSLHAPNGTELDTRNIYRSVGKIELSATASQSGEYALKIESIGDEVSKVQYTVHAPASEAPTKEQPEMKSGTQQENETNDNRSKAQPITRKEISGEVSSKDDLDWYSIPVKKGEEVSVLFTKEKTERYGKGMKLNTEVYAPGVYYNWSVNPEGGVLEEVDTRLQVVITAEESGSIDIKARSSYNGTGEYEVQIAKTQQSDSSSGSGDGTPATTDATQSTSSNTATEGSDDQTETKNQKTNTGTKSTTDEESTSLFGPGFTGPGALVALFVTALFALRRRA